MATTCSTDFNGSEAFLVGAKAFTGYFELFDKTENVNFSTKNLLTAIVSETNSKEKNIKESGKNVILIFTTSRT